MKGLKRQDYLPWNVYFMAMAQVSAQRSKDPNTQVGAVVVKPAQKIIVSTGYNGFPRGVNDDLFPWNRDENWLDSKYPYVAHAELNAIVAARSDLTGCEIYVTLFPCNECAKIIIQSGIAKLYYLEDKYAQEPNFIASKKMLDAAGIKYESLNNVEVAVKWEV
ncbi:deoxycytidylate deaminase [Entomoplasma freundtii]